MKKVAFFLFVSIVIGCTSDSNDSIKVIEKVAEEVLEESLNAKQLTFITEYDYITNRSNGDYLSEKWSGEIKLFLDGTISDHYINTVRVTVDIYNNLFTDGTLIVLVKTFAESDIHLYFGHRNDIEPLWPDMYNRIKGGNYSGFGLNSDDGNYNFNKGRIWVSNSSASLLIHEIGHVLGLAHASNTYCEGDYSSRSFMCPSLSDGLTNFDRAIVKILYHPNITTGKSFAEQKPIITELLLTNTIQID